MATAEGVIVDYNLVKEQTMNFIDFRKELLDVNRIIKPIFKECRPKLLIVTDGLNYSGASGFGLTQFVNTLAATPIHGMIPQIVKASRGADPNADIQNFDFTNVTNGLLKSRYDVVFLFGIDQEGVGQLPQTQVDAIARFMQAGGGVFATGDHEDLGTALSRDVPRVRNMRYWLPAETPDFADTTRLSTNLPGDDLAYAFADQSDLHAQRLYVNYRTQAGGIGNPHPLLQGGPLGAIEVFPDHPHEGECRVPSDLTTTFALDGGNPREWPDATAGGGAVSPEMVALTMSHGDSFPGKEALTPRAFMAVSAYDGQRAGKGRVVTDATWHHFVNINIDGTGSGLSGLQDPPGTDIPDLQRIRQYYRNLATWLMPKNVRKCLRFPWVLWEISRFPLFEELRLPVLQEAKGEDLREIGVQLASALGGALPGYQAEQLIADALEDAVGEVEAVQLLGQGDLFGRLSGRNMGLAALGAVTVSTVMTLAEVRDLPEVDPHKTFTPMAERAAKLGVERYVNGRRKDFQELDMLMRKIAPEGRAAQRKEDEILESA